MTKPKCPGCKGEMICHNGSSPFAEFDCLTCNLWSIVEIPLEDVEERWWIFHWKDADEMNGALEFEASGATMEECFRKLKLQAFK